MKAYVLSNDIYFKLGMITLLTEAGFEVCLSEMSYDEIINTEEALPGSLILFDLRNKTQSIDFFTSDIYSGANVVFIVERFGVQDFMCNSFILAVPDKARLASLITRLKNIVKNCQRRYARKSLSLSDRENIVLMHYINGDSPKDISERLNISIKTFSTYKLNALNKLGVRRISSRSLIYLNSYISRRMSELPINTL
ncbi:LuxR C-terminal-related transcriptional regulator [Enterobacter sp. UNJFSC 003]|uniref:helix-turn-helix transcriptional regulator n=1 Tax=Enterobacter sp. UNJFSC 003 TaxID=3122077 RepID=UPI002EC7DE63|nr:LuxR C-terminal-related transcriptional regulator [Serratia liquefaciens]